MSEEINREESRGRVASLHVADRFRAMFGERVEPRATPETDALNWSSAIGDALEQRRTQLARIHDVTSRLEHQRNEALELLASEKSTRNAIIAKGVETERQRDEALEELRQARAEMLAAVRKAGEMGGLIRAALVDLGCVCGLDESDSVVKRGAMKLLEQALRVGCVDQRDGVDGSDRIDGGVVGGEVKGGVA